MGERESKKKSGVLAGEQVNNGIQPFFFIYKGKQILFRSQGSLLAIQRILIRCMRVRLILVISYLIVPRR